MTHDRQSRLNVGIEGEGDEDDPRVSATGERVCWFLRQEKQQKGQFGRWSAEL